MLEIYAVKLEKEIRNDIYEGIFSCIPLEKQNRIKRFRRFEDAHRATIAEALIRSIIISVLGIKNEDMEFKTNEYGKPYLEGADNFHYNLSHSGEYVVCAVSDKPVGIDIERIKDMKFDIAERFFSKEETQSLLSIDEEYRLERFFDFWTLKESYIKADGKGLSIPLDSFSFQIKEDEICLTTQNELFGCFFKQYNIDKNYKLSACSLVKEFPDHVIFKEEKELYEIMSR
ncbi:MAG: 4'-phosphopantetheinyl transferase superfamily protein [Clostridiaceae bacterium]|nr:4'-phosphopantetheinyl transferase superfamily protein [Clostridiaceae bacterium]